MSRIGRDPAPARLPDPRGVRAIVVEARGESGPAPIVLEPPAIPVAPSRSTAGVGVLGGIAPPPPAPAGPGADPPTSIVLVDGVPASAELTRLDAVHSELRIGEGGEAVRQRVVLLGAHDAQSAPPGVRRREVLVGGWRVVVDVESERRAALRERARRSRDEVGHGGPLEVHAIIPGVVVAVSVAVGDAVVAGQQLLVVEAMKMQNELRSPRDGRIARAAVVPGQRIEVGNLLLVIE